MCACPLKRARTCVKTRTYSHWYTNQQLYTQKGPAHAQTGWHSCMKNTCMKTFYTVILIGNKHQSRALYTNNLLLELDARWLITESSDSCQLLGRLCDWSTDGKHKQKFFRVEYPSVKCMRRKDMSLAEDTLIAVGPTLTLRNEDLTFHRSEFSR